MPPWVDKQGGFSVGDDSEQEAWRAITEDCFGLLLYATPDVFERPFIREVEIPAAWSARRSDPAYVLFAVPRRISFSDLRERSERHFGFDISRFHTSALPDSADLAREMPLIASAVCEKVLGAAASPERRLAARLQFSTRELMPDGDDDILRIDATGLFRSGMSDASSWDRLISALRNVKAAMAATLGRPRLAIHGSKHLSTAFVFGRVFAHFEMDIRQTPELVWSSDGPVSPGSLLRCEARPCRGGAGGLFVEEASRGKDVADGVERFIRSSGVRPSVRLQLCSTSPTRDIDAAGCRAMVEQTYAAIEESGRTHPDRFASIHLFAAAPQSFMMLLGRKFKGTPPVHIYEWTSGGYVHCCEVSGEVL